MDYIQYFLYSLYAFYLLYVACMAIYRGYLKGTLNTLNKVLGAPIVVVALLIDFAMNVTLFTILFLELPNEWLVTDRLKSHIPHRNTWRGKFAYLLCHHLLSPLDPTGDHCD